MDIGASGNGLAIREETLRMSRAAYEKSGRLPVRSFRGSVSRSAGMAGMDSIANSME